MYLPSLLSTLLPLLLSTTALAKTGPLTVAYVEVNSNSIDNTARYILSDNSPVFDIAIIFASNIHSENNTATWYNNENIQAILSNAACEIVPLQEHGIKVLLSLLGGGTGKGISNFVSYDEAAAFAKVAAEQINKYNLDGIDLDDEYAQYGDNGTPPTNNNSIIWLLQALRKELPNKLITMYNYGPAAAALAQSSTSLSGVLNYAWNPYYGSFSPPRIPGLGKDKTAAAAISIASTDLGTAEDLATRTVQEGYGVYLTYNLADGNQSDYVGGFAKALYGLETSYVDFDPGCCPAA